MLKNESYFYVVSSQHKKSRFFYKSISLHVICINWRVLLISQGKLSKSQLIQELRNIDILFYLEWQRYRLQITIVQVTHIIAHNTSISNLITAMHNS